MRNYDSKYLYPKSIINPILKIQKVAQNEYAREILTK